MSALVPARPKIYHIVHMDRLASIAKDGALYSDAIMRTRPQAGAEIGYDHIKRRRLRTPLRSHRELFVGECVPFYFCPRSPMLYKITQRSNDLSYRGGDGLIVHLEADLYKSIAWADRSDHRWAFTNVSAATGYFEDFVDIGKLTAIDWEIVRADWWQGRAAEKQAEFLMEGEFAWRLIERIACRSEWACRQVRDAISPSDYPPRIEAIPSRYYSSE